MPRYQLDITVKGHDKASGPLGKVGGALGKMAKIGLGGLALGVGALGVAVGKLAFDGIGAASAMQNLGLALETLVAKEIARGEEVTKSRQQVIHLTEKEKLKLQELQLEYNTFGSKMKEQEQRVWSMTNKWGEQGLATQTAKNKLAEMRHEYGLMGNEIDTLAAKEGKLVTVQEKVYENTMELSDALKLATPKAEELELAIRDLSIVSPFEFQQVADTFRFTLAMGASTDTAMDLTAAILDTGAAMGLSSEMMGRLNYNMAQALIGGDLTSQNLRQLAMTGIDLAEVFERELGMSIEEVRAQLKSGKLEMEDVSTAFMEYANKNFGGAAERMSRTFTGLQSSIADVFFFAGADLLTPALEVVTESLGGIFDKARDIVESGVLRDIGERIGTIAEALLTGDWTGVFGGLAGAFGELGASTGLQGALEALAPLFEALQAIGQGDAEGAILNIAVGIAELVAAVTGLDLKETRELAISIREFGEGAWEAARGFGELVAELAEVAWGKTLEALTWLKDTILPPLGEALEFVSDNWEIFGAAIAGAVSALAGVAAVGAVIGILSGIVAAINPVVLAIAGIGAAVGLLVAAWQSDWGGIRSTTEKVIGGLQKAFEKLEPVFAVVGDLVSGVAAAFEGGGLAAAVEEFAAIWPALEYVVALSVQTILETVGQALGIDLPGVFTELKEFIEVAMGDAWIIFEDAWNAIRAVVESALAVIGPAVETFIESVKGSFDSFGPAIEAFKELWVALQPVLQVLLTALGAIVVTAVGVIVGIFTGLAHAIGPVIEGIVGIFTGLVTTITGIVDVLVGLITLIVGAIEGDSEKVTAAWEQVKKGVGEIVEGLVTVVVSAVEGMVEGVLGLVGGFVDGIIKFFESLYKELVGGSIIPDMINDILKWFGDMPGRIVKAVEKGFNALIKLGKNIVKSIKQGIKEAWDNFVRWLSGKVSSLIDSLLAAAGFGSPSKPLMAMGRGMVESLQIGWEQQFSQLQNMVSTDLGGLVGATYGGSMGGLSGGATRTLVPAVNVQGSGGGGDTINFYVQDQGSTALALAYVEDRRAERLNASMGG